MASHFHIFRTKDLKIEKKDDHDPIFQCLDVEYFFPVQWSRSLTYEKLIFNNAELRYNLETDLCDLDFVTLRSLGYVDLVHNYL